jgi:ArsR family transcriptional regulator, lead/cadmium/zinc/bismuth-responsive transcriptional repressor
MLQGNDWLLKNDENRKERVSFNISWYDEMTMAKMGTAEASERERTGGSIGTAEHIAPRRVSPRPTEEALERAAGIFRAAGDVSRLRVLDLLMDGEQCVSALSQTLNVGMSTVSQQLRLLREENVVTSRRAGKHIFYALADDHVRDIVRSVLAHAGHCEYLPGGTGDDENDG